MFIPSEVPLPAISESLQFQFGAFFSAVMTKKIELNTCPDSSKKKIQITKDIFWPVSSLVNWIIIKKMMFFNFYGARFQMTFYWK